MLKICYCVLITQKIKMFNKNREKIDKLEQMICVLIIMNRNLESEIQNVREERKKMRELVNKLEALSNSEKVQRETYI